MDNLPLVAICVATYKRPQFLRDLLESIAKVSIDGVEAKLIVVDNDPSETAREILESVQNGYPIGSRYVVEGARGIASVRNRLVSEARALKADYLVFIDDDELVDAGWLKEIVRVAEIYEADGVTGRVDFRFEGTVPRWMQSGSLLAYPRTTAVTGQSVLTAGTGNLLLRISSMNNYPEPFDERFNLLGGSDAHFIQRFRRDGHKLVASDAAVVYERVAESRTSIRWLLRRSFRYGLAQAIIAEDLEQPHSKLKYTLTSLGLLARSILIVVPSLVRAGRPGLLNQMWIASAAIGRISRLFGVRYEEYRRTHGK